MIALLSGRVALAREGRLVVDVNGVGYLVHVPPGVPAEHPVGRQIRLHVATVVREDAIMLYGFDAPEERDAFELLRGVSGIGPRLALALLGHLGLAELARAVAAEDVAALARTPGVGRKTAHRVCLELRNRLPALAPGAAPARPAAAAPGDPLPLALQNLGYTRQEIEAALASPDVPAHDTAPDGERLRAAISVLSRPR